jgi:putative phosphoesterase
MLTERLEVIKKDERGETVKTVGLISDTHIPTRARSIPRKVFQVFDRVDFIIHAGDLVQLSIIEDLEQIAPVLAVSGNMDKPEATKRLPKMSSLKILDHSIGVTHDPGGLFGLAKMRETAKKNKFDVLVYGHTHMPSVKWEGSTLYVNPGSPTNPVLPFIKRPSIAVLRIGTERIAPEIIYI